MAYGDNQDVMQERRQSSPWQQSIQSPAPPVAYPGGIPGAPTSSAGAPSSSGAPSASGGTDPWAAPQGDWTNADFIRQQVARANQLTGGQGDPNYWIQKGPELISRGQQIGDPNYFWNRLIGMGDPSTKVGPYANQGGGVTSMEQQLMTRGGADMSAFPNLFKDIGASSTGASGDLMKYLLGRGTGQISDASLPALNVSPNDPIVKAQTDAYRAEQDRGVRSLLSAEAEKAGMGANLGAETRSAYEKAAQSTAGYEGQVMQHELDSRRQEIQQALSGAMGFITSEQAMALQEELAQLDLAQRAFESDTSFQLRGMGL